MRQFAIATVLAVAVAGCGSSSPTASSGTNNQPNVITFTAQMTSAQETPPITNADTGATGTASIVFNLTRDSGGNITAATANFAYSLANFPAGTVIRLSHIHEGALGVGPGAVKGDTGLSPATAITLATGATSSAITFNNIPVDATLAKQIIDGPAGYYFNVHSNLNPGGAVRGQLVKQ